MRKSFSILCFLIILVIVILLAVIIPGRVDADAEKPVADAGPDLVVAQFGKAVLDGSSSANAGEFRWTQTEGPRVELSDRRSVAPYFRSGTEGAHKFKLTVKNGRETDTDEVTVTVQNAPFIEQLKFRGLNYDYSDSDVRGATTNADSVDISVYVRDAAHLATVVCKNETTGETYSAGDLNGHYDSRHVSVIPSVKLTKGDNSITVKATDNLGQTDKRTVTVTYNTAVKFTEGLHTSRDTNAISVGFPLYITFVLKINEKEGYVPESFGLYEVNQSGANIAKIGTLQKDAGEEGLYKGKFLFRKYVAGAYFYRAECLAGSEIQRSTTSAILAKKPVTEEDCNLVKETIDRKLDDVLSKGYPSSVPYSMEYMIHDYVEALQNTNGVKQVNHSGNSRLIGLEFENGVQTFTFFSKGISSRSRHNFLLSILKLLCCAAIVYLVIRIYARRRRG